MLSCHSLSDYKDDIMPRTAFALCFACMYDCRTVKAISHYYREVRARLTALNPARLKFFPIYIAAYYLVEVCC